MFCKPVQETEMAAINLQRSTARRLACLASTFAVAAMLGGCSLQRLVVNRVGDAMAAGGEVYASDPDVELVGAATPFGLKLLESLLAESPEHRGLLLALARSFTQYAYVYVEEPADELEDHDVNGAYAARDRARRLYLRARDYGLRGLESSHPGFRAQFASAPDQAMAALRREDVPLLYWTAASWGAAISLGKDDAFLIGDLPSVQRLANRALALDESYDNGALHVLFISLTMSEAGPEERRIAAARQHFERALALSAGHQAAPYVSYAEAVAIATGRRSEFDDSIKRALQVDVAAEPRQRLANEVFQRRATWLRERADQLFAQ